MKIEKLEQLTKKIENLGIEFEMHTFVTKNTQKKYLLERINYDLTLENNIPNEIKVFIAIANSSKLKFKLNHSMIKNTQITEQEMLDLKKLLQTVRIFYSMNEQRPFICRLDTSVFPDVSNIGNLLEYLQKGTELSFSFNDISSNNEMAKQIVIRFIVDYLTKNKIKEKILSHIKEDFLK